MARHVVGRADDVPPGGRMLVQVDGREVVVFNLSGEFFALLNRCPHQGGRLACGRTTGLVEAAVPGEYRYTRPGEILRCPWHGWEFDIRTGQSRCQPDRIRARALPVSVAAGAALREEEMLAVEIFPIKVGGDYLVIEA